MLRRSPTCRNMAFRSGIIRQTSQSFHNFDEPLPKSRNLSSEALQETTAGGAKKDSSYLRSSGRSIVRSAPVFHTRSHTLLLGVQTSVHQCWILSASSDPVSFLRFTDTSTQKVPSASIFGNLTSDICHGRSVKPAYRFKVSQASAAKAYTDPLTFTSPCSRRLSRIGFGTLI